MSFTYRRTALEELTDAVDELVQPRTHREPYAHLVGNTWIHDRHVTHVASLLDQLEIAVEPSGSTVGGHRVPSSTPAARMDAINALIVIDTEVSQEVQTYLGQDRGTIPSNLRALVGLAAELGILDQKAMARSARRWRTMAAIVTGWEVAPRRLHNSCPLCACKGSLRVRIDTDMGTATGLCVECQETWDEHTIGLLAAHIRSENNDLDELEATA